MLTVKIDCVRSYIDLRASESADGVPACIVTVDSDTMIRLRQANGQGIRRFWLNIPSATVDGRRTVDVCAIWSGLRGMFMDVNLLNGLRLMHFTSLLPAIGLTEAQAREATLFTEVFRLHMGLSFRDAPLTDADVQKIEQDGMLLIAKTQDEPGELMVIGKIPKVSQIQSEIFWKLVENHWLKT